MNANEKYREIIKAAELGDPDAQKKLIRLYSEGLCKPADEAEAIRWWLMSASHGSCAAPPADAESAEIEGREEALSSSSRSQLSSGEGSIEISDWLPSLYDKAEEWYRALANAGDAGAQNIMGILHMIYDPYYAGEDTNIWYHNVLNVWNAGEELWPGYKYLIENSFKEQQPYCDCEQAIKWFRMAANQGHVQAQYNLGLMYDDAYYSGRHQNNKEAATWFMRAAERGHVQAQYKFGLICHSSIAVIRDDVAAACWIEKAASQGLAEAQYTMGCFYRDGIGVKVNYIAAEQWLQKAADHGRPEAIYDLGMIHYLKSAVPQDAQKAVKLFHKAAELDYKMACYQLGFIYAEGRYVPKDELRALDYWRKSYAIDLRQDIEKWYYGRAEAGDANAQYFQGILRVICNTSKYYHPDKWIGEAPENARWFVGGKISRIEVYIIYDDIYTMGKKGYHKRKCKLSSVTQDYKIALEWFRKAADREHIGAQINLGRMYIEGLGIAQNVSIAEMWYMKAAESGNKDVQHELGEIYSKGPLEIRNLSMAAMWYRKAAEQGLDRAQVKMAEIYACGRGVPKNETEGLKWYYQVSNKLHEHPIGWERMAAEHGDNYKQYSLGMLYSHGDNYGRDVDEEEALKWFQMAADNGVPEAQYQLGKMLADRHGTSENICAAKKWFLLAAGNGHEAAQYYLGWIQRTAEKGNIGAQYILGVIHATGRYAPRDYVEAAKWWGKAAIQDHVDSQVNLAILYEHGYGVTQNWAEAVKWHEKAAKRGSVRAQVSLEYIYGNSACPLYNTENAAKWRNNMATIGISYEQDDEGEGERGGELLEWGEKAPRFLVSNANIGLGAISDIEKNEYEAARIWHAIERAKRLSPYTLSVADNLVRNLEPLLLNSEICDNDDDPESGDWMGPDELGIDEDGNGIWSWVPG